MGKQWVYKFSNCPECGGNVADNWFIRHVKSECKVGIIVPKNTPNNPNKLELKSSTVIEHQKQTKLKL